MSVDLQRQIDALRAQVDYLTALQQPNQDLSTGSSVVFAGLALATGDIEANTWTPTLTNTTNIDASTSAAGWYIRVGINVMCGVRIEIDATAAAATVIGISLPIASNIGAAGDVVGTIASRPGGTGHVNGDSGANEATASFNALLTTNQAFYVTFIYTVI